MERPLAAPCSHITAHWGHRFGIHLNNCGLLEARHAAELLTRPGSIKAFCSAPYSRLVAASAPFLTSGMPVQVRERLCGTWLSPISVVSNARIGEISAVRQYINTAPEQGRDMSRGLQGMRD